MPDGDAGMFRRHSTFLQGACGLGIGLGVVGVVLSTSGASGDQMPAQPFYVACYAATQVEPADAAMICADLIFTLQEDPGLAVVSDQPAPLAVGPGLELRVDVTTRTALEVTPTWVDADGERVTQPAVGLRIADAHLTESLRRKFFRRLLANSSR